MKDDQIPKPNMTPMIDVVFQLLVFFLVSMKFKTLDMKIEAQLPTEFGIHPIGRPPERLTITARLDRPLEGAARLKVDGRVLGRTDDPAAWQRLGDLARGVRERHLANGGDPSVVDAEVDAVPQVPTGVVIRAVDAFTEAQFEKVRFTGTPVHARR
jgi:hypothetical protein